VHTTDVKVSAGFFLMVPRGVPHSIQRQGRNPLILLSVLAGAPCADLPR
jgi:mannose-6-phosphate isomerase-like protein (cupin superfamily)